eukprot:504501-Hanusia_phi.AAC.2
MSAAGGSSFSLTSTQRFDLLTATKPLEEWLPEDVIAAVKESVEEQQGMRVEEDEDEDEDEAMGAAEDEDVDEEYGVGRSESEQEQEQEQEQEGEGRGEWEEAENVIGE